ncbi:MAG: hypothetical protein KDA37_03230 [Planctomycetales bacterium]|nr:hypothetical protein [Planctomycetales bacterium]
MRTETGALDQLIKQLTSQAYLLRHPATDKRPFVQPEEELRYARRAASYLMVGEVEEAAEAAYEFKYELIEYHDTDAGARYYVLREDLSRIETARGWGAFLLNPEPEFEALIEAPHPLGDSNSAQLASRVFAEGARALLIAGAHRKKADLPDFEESVFHQVHASWIGGNKTMPVLQVHGFAAYKHNFPEDAQLILSTGGGQVIEELQHLDSQFDRHGFPCYVYNTLDPRSKENKKVNGDAPGDQFRSLAATKNEQGKQVREEGGKFVHLEFEIAIRHDRERRERAAQVVAQTMSRLAPAERTQLRQATRGRAIKAGG